MKKINAIVIGLALATTTLAQAPQQMSYQAVIRNTSNTLITSASVGMRISVLQGSSTGTAVYVETQTPATNANGLATLSIGGGTVITGTFSAINWATGPYFLKTETDPTGGTSYNITGTTQLLSVPYALYAAQSGGNTIPSGLIVMWSGLITNIPSGWALCNGTSGTPNLTNKFIYGVSSAQNPGATGGDTTHSFSVPMTDIISGGSSSSQIGYSAGSAQYFAHYTTTGWWEPNGTYSSLSSPSTTYGTAPTTTNNGNCLPPYYKLAFIMKL